jgi:hypothetical protein
VLTSFGTGVKGCHPVYNQRRSDFSPVPFDFGGRMRDFVDSLGSRHMQGDSWVTGILLGIFLPFLAGLVYIKLYPSFGSIWILVGAML